MADKTFTVTDAQIERVQDAFGHIADGVNVFRSVIGCLKMGAAHISGMDDILGRDINALDYMCNHFDDVIVQVDKAIESLRETKPE